MLVIVVQLYNMNNHRKINKKETKLSYGMHAGYGGPFSNINNLRKMRKNSLKQKTKKISAKKIK